MKNSEDSDATASMALPLRQIAPGRSEAPADKLRGVEDPIHFARVLQEWKAAATDRNRMPRYRVVQRLGQGSQGLVFSVADRDCMREVALKTLHAGARSPEDMSRFIHEAQITAQLEHPGIVPIHDLDVLPDGTIFYTMKQVEGRTLADVIGDVSRPDRAAVSGQHKPQAGPVVDDLLHIMLRVCDAIAFAHSRGVIHRDLKPRNLMIGRYGEVLVMDWGLAKILKQAPDPLDGERQILSLRSIDDGADSTQTMTGCAVGTPAYMSPEQARGSNADRRSDVYSLGVILYHCLSGESPYERGRVRYTLEQAAGGIWTRLEHREISRRLPRRLIAIVHRCMELDPAERYQSVEALSADVRAFMGGRAVAAYRESVWSRVLRTVSTQRRVVFTGLAIALISLIMWWTSVMAEASSMTEQIVTLRRTAAQSELMGEFDEARRGLERIVDLDADDRQALDGLQRLRVRLAQRAEQHLAQHRKADTAALVVEQVRSAMVLVEQAERLQVEAGSRARQAEAAPMAQVPELLQQRLFVLNAALEKLQQAIAAAPTAPSVRSAWVAFQLDRVEEAEAAGQAQLAQSALALARALDDGAARAAIAGLAHVSVAAQGQVVIATRVDDGSSLKLEPGQVSPLPVGHWRFIGPQDQVVERRLARGQQLSLAWPTNLVAGDSWIPGGWPAGHRAGTPIPDVRFMAGEILKEPTVDRVEAWVALHRELRGAGWRLPTSAERRLAQMPYVPPAVVQDEDGLWALTAADRRQRLDAVLLLHEAWLQLVLVEATPSQ